MQLELDFTFTHRDAEGQLGNDVVYTLRHNLVTAFMEGGYGDIIEDGDDFSNTHATPFVSAYVGERHHEMFIGYLLDVNNNINDGNLANFLIENIPRFHTEMGERFPDVRIDVRTIYIF